MRVERGSGGNAIEQLACRGDVPPAPRKESRQRFERTSGRLLLQPLEHVEVFALDHRPRVMAPEELVAVLAEAGVERPVRLERIQRLDELLVTLVVQPGVAADALSL